MHRLTALTAAFALAACAAPPAATGYRTGDGQIASAALFDPARFADVWHVVAAYGPDAGCGPLAETWTPTGPGAFRVTGTACGPAGSRAFAGDARVTGPGRVTRDGLRGREELWVLWVDQDYRIAAIGTPDGSFGRIIARSPEARPDLYEAAREVMDFNGYDTGRLTRL
jgi:apolipoprotein D and lipocalin family protein